MGITELITGFSTLLISKSGYYGVTFLMALESMVFPVPSEAVMPFAGFLVYEKTFSFGATVFYSTLGSIIGSLLSYYIGYYGGRFLIIKYGRYFLLNVHHLHFTEKFFKKNGEITILICRFIPVVRHFISLPAGASEMNIYKFLFYTIIGAGLWNACLCYVGMLLRQKWSIILRYSHLLDYLILAVILGAIVYFMQKQLSKRK